MWAAVLVGVVAAAPSESESLEALQGQEEDGYVRVPETDRDGKCELRPSLLISDYSETLNDFMY